MVIECPHCATRFKLEARQLSDSRSMLKCAHCRRVFPAPGQPTGARRPKRPAAEDNMSFSFDDEDDEWRAPELTSEDVPEDAFLLNAPAGAAAEPAPPRPRRPRSPRTVPEQESLRFDDPDEDEEAEAEAADPDEVDEAAEEEEFVLGDVPAARATEPRRGGISVRSVFVFLAVVVCGYGALTWSLLDDPDWAGKLTKDIPIIGASLREVTAGEDIALVEVNGRYERTKDGKVVFVITGQAVNQSADTLRSVQIAAALQDAGERQLQQQVTACGNALEAKIRELSVHQVNILRSIKPPPDLGMQPGSRCPFVTIFTDLPGGATTFTTEVVRAQRYA